MLHALLHNKLDPSIPEPRRLEDAVTSTVFGTLLLSGHDDLLAAWFTTMMGDTGEQISGKLHGCWFWPRLAHAEPDVVLAMGEHLIVVEAKVRSGRHDLGADQCEVQLPEAPVRDQLCREWGSIALARNSPGLPEGLADAARQLRPCLVYLVDQRRIAKAQRELAESRRLLPLGADVRLLTWQALHRLLHGLANAPAAPRCVTDLLEYLEIECLAGFVGFTNTSPTAAETLYGVRLFALGQALRTFDWMLTEPPRIGQWLAPDAAQRSSRLRFLTPVAMAEFPGTQQQINRFCISVSKSTSSPNFFNQEPRHGRTQ